MKGNSSTVDDRLSKYWQVCLKSECVEIADTKTGNRNNQLNKSAFRLGQIYQALLNIGFMSEPSETVIFIDLYRASQSMSEPLQESEYQRIIINSFAQGRTNPIELSHLTNGSIDSTKKRDIHSKTSGKVQIRWITEDINSRFSFLKLDDIISREITDADINLINQKLRKAFKFKALHDILKLKIYDDGHRKGIILWGTDDVVFNPNGIEDKILHVEGRTDLLSAVTINLHTAFSLISHFNKESHITLTENSLNVFILDSDVTSEHIMSKISCDGEVSAKMIRLTQDCKDLSDYIFNGNTQEDLFELIETAEQLTLNKNVAVVVCPKNPVSPKSNNALMLFKDLVTTELPEVQWLVHGLISHGYTILSGKPKSGKSWFILLWAMCMAQGINLFGKYPCNKKNVLYLGLEDSLVRLQLRILKVCQSENISISSLSDNFFYLTEIPTIGEGGLELLRYYIKDYRIEVVIIDTYKKFTINSGRTSRIQFDQEYQLGMFIQDLTRTENISVIALMHNRKNVSMIDTFDNISGTLGLQAAADTIMVLTRTQKFSRLNISGRDVEPTSLILEFEQGIWKYISDENQITQEDYKIDWESFILEDSVRSEDLVRHLKEEFQISRSTAFAWIKSAIAKGYIHRPKNGFYRYSNEQNQSPTAFRDILEYQDIANTNNN